MNDENNLNSLLFMEASIFLAQIMGPVFAIMMIGLFLNYGFYQKMLDNLLKNPGYLILAGFMNLTLGMLLVLVHNVWQWNWTVLITIFSWMILVKGMMGVIFPELALQVAQHWKKNSVPHQIIVLVFLLLSLCLVYHGYWA